MSKKRNSILEMRIENVLIAHGFKDFVKEHRFHSTRLWRFDFAFLDQKIAVEAEGGIWVGGGHNRGRHFNSDCEKYNQAQLLGWKVLRYTTNTVFQIPDDVHNAYSLWILQSR